MDRENQRIVREALMRHGIDPSLSRHVLLGTTPGGDGEEARGSVTIGYTAGGGWRETAVVSTPDYADAVDLVTTRDRLAPLLALGVRAMPTAERPTIPDWVARHPEARRTTRDLTRARSLAADAADGRTVDTRDGDGDDDAPF